MSAREESLELIPTSDSSDALESEFHFLTSSARGVEAKLTQCALEARMRQSHAHRQLSEEMLGKQLEENEERVGALSRTQSSLADVSRLGLLAHARFPLAVVVLLFALAFVKFTVVQQRTRFHLLRLIAKIRQLF
jgi:hypothetical protein